MLAELISAGTPDCLICVSDSLLSGRKFAKNREAYRRWEFKQLISELKDLLFNDETVKELVSQTEVLEKALGVLRSAAASRKRVGVHFQLTNTYT